MVNKLKDNLSTIVFMISVVIIGVFSIEFALNNISSIQTNQNDTNKENGINKKAFDVITKSSSYNSDPLLESGFGRENPFAPYK